MSKMVEWQDVSFTYRQRQISSISHISLAIEQGDFVLLTGATGCGKSTLLKTLNGLIPQESGGLLTGNIFVMGQNTHGSSIAHLSQSVGMVFQSPDDQIFSTTVFDETAFVLENMGMSAADIQSRVHETLRLVGLYDQRDSSIYALSGGQKQRLAVASVLAARPKILALDEPISQLDPQGAAELLSLLQKLNRELNMTIVIVEHRLHEVLPLCRHVVIMADGKVLWQGTREEAYGKAAFFHDQGLRLPQTIDICHGLGILSRSASVTDTVEAIEEQYQVPAWHCTSQETRPDAVSSSLAAVEINHLTFQYEAKGRMILQDIELSIPQGQFVALMGTNGAGKSTLLHQIGGLLKPVKGQVRVMGQALHGLNQNVGMVLQNPDLMLFNSSVAAEVTFSLQQKNGQVGCSFCYEQLMDSLKLRGLENDFPLALSRGQRLRVAIAAVLSAEPLVLLLDEPTTGQDIGHIEDIITLLKEYTTQGGTVIFCTHDTEVAARFSDRILVLGQGKIVADDIPQVVFSQEALLRENGLKAPSALLTAKNLYGGQAVTVQEVVDYVRQEGVGSYAGPYAVS